jgi:DNA (cytosine-5)-methyltransferase 1
MTNQPFQYDTELKLGQSRGKPRVWIEGKRLGEAGFLPGTKFSARFEVGKVTLEAFGNAVAQDRTVSGRDRGDGAHPIIDISTADLAKVFPNTERIAVRMTMHTITITPARTLANVAARVATSVAVGLFVGAGLLSQAAKAAGFETRAAVEWNTDYANIHDANHGGHMMNSDIADARIEDAARMIGPVGLLHAGIPCEPFSKIRRNDGTNTKVDKTLVPEAHELGDMTFWTLRAVDVFNPHTVVIEEVPAWLDSGAGWIARHALRRMGYVVDWKVINATDYGAITQRKRAVMVATSFDSVRWPEPQTSAACLSDYLLKPDDPACEWFDRKTPTKRWLFDHWQKQTTKGNGFASQLIHYTDRTIGTIKKRYFAGQGDNPVVVHPNDSDRYRWLTITEVKLIMALPDGYDLGESKTTAGEAMGQGVEVSSFSQIICSVTRWSAFAAGNCRAEMS